METTVEALQDNRVKVTATVDAKEIDARIRSTYKDFANKYSFPGFRKGKAPRPVIDNALGAEAVRATVTDEVVNEQYPLAIDAEDLYPTGQPEFGDLGLVESGKPFEFTFTVEVRPELELSSYDPVEIDLPPEGATEAEIEGQIDGLRDHYFTYEDAPAATKAKADSRVMLALKAVDDAGDAIDGLTDERFGYNLGSGLLPESFDAEIVGMKKGQKKEFSIDVPAETYAYTSALAGKTAKIGFEAEVVAVQKKVLPELTDEWAKDTLGFEGVDDLRKRIVETIEQQKSDLIPRMKENQCLVVLAERLQGEVPQSMVDENETTLLQDFFQQLQRQGMPFDAYLQQQGLTADQFKEDVKQQALDMAKQDLALDAWARHAGMKATDADVAEEFVKSGVENPSALQEEWRKNGRLHLVRAGILRTNAIKEVMDAAKVTEVVPGGEGEGEKAAKKPAKKAAKKAAKKPAKKAKDDAADEGAKAEGE